MALKGLRVETTTDISFFMDQVAERGGICVMKTAGSGQAMDQAAAEVEYVAASSGKYPVGLLLNDVVNIDMTRQHLNQHKNEVQKGSKVTLLREGFVVTNYIAAVTPAAGDIAYLGASGLLTNSNGSGGNPQIGRFDSTKDEDGYCKVYVKLPK